MVGGGLKGGRPIFWVIGLLFLGATAFAAFSRMGLLDLPRVPSDLSVASAGLPDMEASRKLDDYIRHSPNIFVTMSSALNHEVMKHPGWRMRHGVEFCRLRGEESAMAGLQLMREEVRSRPSDSVLGNSYRMEVFRLRREFLKSMKSRGELTPQFPIHLDRQPIAFFEELVRDHPSRETKLQLALAWVDEMLLFPALEIKAPSSVQSVDILTELLSTPGNEWYVPALFARGLNHLHRPSRLVWPENAKTPVNAAVLDIAKCVAAGRKFGVGSERLHATLAIALGDAYVKAGRNSSARSWWQIAQNLCSDDDLQQSIRRRYSWPDEQILDRLEEELDRSRTELDHPMTDLALMWN